ncbi:hypothetical protein AB0D12_31905 [Streptomyces sp. NPDC048479]|uniref:hypothetical protein n=1 Tax=Streptomyces sp. NPDC048479 TaxID=3154725 RepID=UPI003449B853
MPDITPTAEQLRAIADFIDEQHWVDTETAIGADVAMRHRNVQLHVTEGKPSGEQKSVAAVTAWVEQFTPDRTREMGRMLARMADQISGAAAIGLDTEGAGSAHDARRAWRLLTRVARLWSDRPGFLPEWAETEKPAQADAGT